MNTPQVKQQQSAPSSGTAAAIKRLFLTTPIEIGLGAALLTAVFGIVRYDTLRRRESELPLAFSEIEQTTQSFEQRGLPVPPLTKFYSLTNDVAMKVFESNNLALAKDREHETFAKELRTRVEQRYKVHALISEYVAHLPQDARDALQTLSKLTSAAAKMPAIEHELNEAWDESHSHHYKTVTRTRRSNGKTTTYTDRVYDYTIHRYTYDSGHGERAAALLNEFAAQTPDIRINERLELAKNTLPQNQQAMQVSMARQFEGHKPDQIALLKLANTWATGSNLTTFLPEATQNHAALLNDARAWSSAKGSARSTSYRTYSRSDSGPKEFRVAREALRHSREIQENIARIVEGIRFVERTAPDLDRQIREYISVAMKQKPGDADQMREGIMQLARDMYQKNYVKGFDVQPFKWGDIILMSFLGFAVGGGIGFGVDRFIDARARKRPENPFTAA